MGLGLWAVDASPGECSRCGSPATVRLLTDDQLDQDEPQYCSLHCWGQDQDEHTLITGADAQPRMWTGSTRRWNAVARPFPTRGRPGICDHPTAGPGVLLFRLGSGLLAGVCTHERSGQLGVWVDPAQQHNGIGTQLVRAAARRWGVDLSQQHFTPAGLALTRRALPRQIRGGQWKV